MIVSQFRDAMQAAGIAPPGEIVADGVLHRFHCGCKAGRNLNGWYLLHADEPANGVFACHKHLQEPVNWCSKEYKSLTPEEKSRYAANMEAARRQRDAERARVHAECRAWCADTWKRAKDASNDHLYLKKKGVNAYGLKLLKGALMVPVRDMAGTLHGLQFINPDGAKKFKTGTNKTGHFHTIGKAKDKTVIIAEGYATAATIHQATGHCVLVAFDSGNLKAVAEAVRAKRPGFRIIVAADNDQWTEGNPGVTKATEAARTIKGLLAVPVFRDASSKPSDFNDLAALESPARVQEIIEATAEPEKPAEEPAPTAGTPASDAAKEGPKAGPAGGQVAPENRWQEPLLFVEIDTPEIPAELLPGWLGEYCKAVAATTQTPPGLSVMFALATVATCLQRRFEVCPYGDEYTEPVNIWTVCALDPGNRKTAVRNAFTGPLMEWEHEETARLKPEIKRVKHQRDINQKTVEQLKARASKPDTTPAGREELLQEIARIEEETPDEMIVPRLWTDDCTSERLQTLLCDYGGRMSLLSDEGGIFEVMAGLYSGGRANLNVFLQGHAGAPIRVDRQGRTVVLNRPALSFGLMVQPDVIGELGSGNKARFRGNGTLARFLYCLPRSTVGTRDVTQRITIPDPIKRAYRDGIMELLTIGPAVDERGRDRPRMLTLTPEALLAWQQFAQYVEDRQGPDGEYYSIQDWTAKLAGAALRIAGLFHVVEHGEALSEIGETIIEKSLDLCDLLIAHARAAFESMGGEPAQKDAQTVLRWIVATGKPSFRQNEALKELRIFRTIERLEQALKILTARNIISEPYKRHTGGRPAILYGVNPAILPSARLKEP